MAREVPPNLHAVSDITGPCQRLSVDLGVMSGYSLNPGIGVIHIRLRLILGFEDTAPPGLKNRARKAGLMMDDQKNM